MEKTRSKGTRPKSDIVLLSLSTVYILPYPLICLWLSGDWFWWKGWIFTLWFFTLCGSVLFYLYRHDPALLRERFQKPGAANAQGWDRYFLYAMIPVFLSWFILIPLDAKRCGWSAPFPPGLQVVGGLGLILSFFFLYRSYTDNSFVSPLVRIQKERKQKVISTGVYGWVRHPMYLGGMAWFLGMPLFMGSWVGMGLGLILISLFVGRLCGEEKMLVKELKGYRAYQKKVKWRLIPLVY